MNVNDKRLRDESFVVYVECPSAGSGYDFVKRSGKVIMLAIQSLN